MSKRKLARQVGPRLRDTESLESRQFFAAHIAGISTNYSTIQAAVNAAVAGSTITVDAGTYAETVTVNKRLTLLGAEAGIDARSNQRRETGPETIIGGLNSGGSVKMAFYVTANGVKIDGFVIQGVTDQSLTKGAGIVIAPNVSGTTIQNNIVQNNVAGLYLANNSSSSAAVIRRNVFRNNNNAGLHGGRAIYTDQTLSGGKLTNVSIDENAFFFNYGGTSTTKLEAAIAFESGTNSQSQTNLNLTNNVFDDNGKAVLAINVDGLKFTGNVVTRGRDFYSGIVRFEGNDHNVTIKNNNLYNNTGPAIAVDVKGFPGDNSGFVVTGNNIYGNGTTAALPANVGKKLGIAINGDAYDGVFDARNNYWGSSSGPSGDGPGTGDGIYGGPGDPKTGKWLVTTTKGTELFASWATAPTTGRDTAFWGTAATDGYRIQAEDFNLGGAGIGYYDTTSGNSGGYRTTDVDLATTADAGGGYAVASTAAGEWLDYAVKLTKGGTYRVDLRVASAAAGATIRILVDGKQLGADAAVPKTASSTTFTTLALSNRSLTAGTHTIRVMFVTKNTAGSCPTFNWMQFTNTAAVDTPAAPTSLTALANGASRIDLTWTNTDANAAGTTVMRSLDGVNFTAVATLPAAATFYSDDGLSPLTAYTYAVVASNDGGDSAPSGYALATTAPADVMPLTALAWTSATSGYLTPQTNVSIKGTPLTLRGATYDSGIGTHADSTIVYDLAGRFNGFTAAVGIDDETAGQGAAVFQVWGDGVLLYDSGTVTGTTAAKQFTIGVKGVQTLTLIATGVNGSIDYAHADWAGAQLLQAAPPAPVTPPAGATVALSSLNWQSATAGYGVVNKDLNSRGSAISLRGTTYASGLGTHADSTIVYALDGKYTTFASDIGVDDAVNGNGTVIFQVIGDGKVLFESGVLTGSSAAVSIAVNVTGVKSLQLVALSTADGIDYDHADWAGASLTAA